MNSQLLLYLTARVEQDFAALAEDWVHETYRASCKLQMFSSSVLLTVLSLLPCDGILLKTCRGKPSIQTSAEPLSLR